MCTFFLKLTGGSFDKVRWCIGEKETYGEACVRVMRCPWVEHGCCVYQLFASGLCMWYKCTCEESHVVDAYLSHGSKDNYTSCFVKHGVEHILSTKLFVWSRKEKLLGDVSPEPTVRSNHWYQKCWTIHFMMVNMVTVFGYLTTRESVDGQEEEWWCLCNVG